MVKSLGAVVVVLLGIAWFLLDALGPQVEGVGQAGAPAAASAAAAPSGSQGSERPGPVSLRPEVPTPAPVEKVVEPPVEPAPAPSEPVPPVAPPATATSAPAGVGTAAAESGRALQVVFQQVEALKAQGDLVAAEAVLRQTIAEATAPADAARAGLILASVATDPAECRRLYTTAFIHGVVIGPEYEEIGEALRRLNADPGSSLVPHLAVDSYEVAEGDSLWALCNRTFPERFGVQPEVGLVRLVNGMRGDTLRVGQTLVVPHDELTIVVAARHHGLVTYLGDVVLMSYRVGLGKQNRTPRGEFTIQVKQENPSWWKDGEVVPYGDPENVLGTRWMGFENRPGTSGFGIHGTAAPSSIGKDMSMGCVRMRNEEIQELFDFVPRGTRVQIQ